MSFDLHLLYLLNHWVGRNAEADSLLRLLAVWGPLWAAWEVARPWIFAEDAARCVRITRNAVLSGAAALLLALLLSHLKARTRPFLAFPVVLLYLAPNDSSFPDLVTALGVGATFGAIFYQRERWGKAGFVTVLWTLARMMSGTMFPTDGLVAAGLGAFPVAVEAALKFIPSSRAMARAGVLALSIGFVAVGWAVRNTHSHLPRLSTSLETPAAVHSQTSERPGIDPRLKGFLPEEESGILAVTA